ncbi:hypothetical protein F7725_027522 [Dissostichus mawsoni]|uniref:trypsin n=1 Tax=Dissostichus mawsoni TaxID=36200 RepID=A0A7J5XD86_DISMA|nr:hypothetical protein F7725_027522 [Dissostichus mawsoni]
MRGLYKFLLLFLLACQDQNVLGSKIINGTDADDDSMKYMVSVQKDDDHICGGFLVSKQFVVTHGGCKCDKKGMVVLGTHHLSKPRNKIKETLNPHANPHLELGMTSCSLKNPEDLPEKIQLQDPETEVTEKCQSSWMGSRGERWICACRSAPVVDVTVISQKACKVQIPRLRANAICTGGKQTTDNGGFCKMRVDPSCARGKLLELRLSTQLFLPGLPNVYIDISKYRSWINVLNGKIDSETMATSSLLLLFFIFNGADGSYIVGGRDAAPNSRPYMASLQVRGRHNCGGALVRGDFVLTAAHCEIPIPYTVVLGANSLTANEPTKQEFTVVRSIPHPNYDGHGNDIMLLKCTTDGLRAADLSEKRQAAYFQSVHHSWLGDVGDNGTLPNRLQEVNVTTLPQRGCIRRWRTVPITRSMVCGIGAVRLRTKKYLRMFQTNYTIQCVKGLLSFLFKGDSGGPLVCDGAAAGVVSFSGRRRCGDPRTPDVYTRISTFRGWITRVLNKN